MIDDGHGGEYNTVYQGEAHDLETSLDDLLLDVFYRLKIQAITEQGAGPFTNASYVRIGTTHVYSGEDFDKNGIIYAIGTDDGQKPFSNPAQNGKVACTRSSDGAGSASLICSRETIDNKTLNQPRQFYMIDMGEDRKVLLTHYTIKGNCYTSAEQPRSWWLQGAVTENDWVMLDKKEDCDVLKSSGASKTFETTTDAAKNTTYRYFRIVQIGKNSSFNFRFNLSGFEMYGTLISNLYGNCTKPANAP